MGQQVPGKGIAGAGFFAGLAAPGAPAATFTFINRPALSFRFFQVRDVRFCQVLLAINVKF